jgi:hypothetical protein
LPGTRYPRHPDADVRRALRIIEEREAREAMRAAAPKKNPLAEELFAAFVRTLIDDGVLPRGQLSAELGGS